MEKFTRFVLRHRLWVFLFWIAMLAGGLATSGGLADKLSFNFAVPGQEGYETQLKLTQAYGTGNYPGYIPVLTATDGASIADHKTELTQFAAAFQKLPGVRVLDYANTGDDAFLTKDGKSTFVLVYAPLPQGFVDPMAEPIQATAKQAAAQNGFDLKMTGYNQLAAGDENNEGPSVLVETLVGAGLALVVLIFVFASFLAIVPLLIAAFAILSTFLAVTLLTEVTEVSFVVQFLISLVGLGVAIDYSLLVVSRWREERARGVPNHEAVVVSMKTAGHAVLASGITVAISLLAMVLVNVPLLRSMGYGGMLIPLMSVLVVLTLLPATLSLIGPRIDWPRIRHEGNASRAWSGWARGVVKFRWLATGAALLILGILIAPVFGLQIGYASSKSLASNGEAHDALVQLEQGGVGTGVLTTADVLVKGGDPAAFKAAIETVPGIRTAVVNPPGKGGFTDVTVVPNGETVDNTNIAVIDDVREKVSGLPGYEGIASLGADVEDYQHAVYGNFPYVLAAIAFITFILLVRTFRSVLLPLKAIVLNLVSLAAVFGLATWFWQEGNGSEQIFSIDQTGAMTFWLPIMIFAFLFGLSMDYEVFILARMREEYDRTGSTALAVQRGLGRTGRLVTSAALILFFAFAALASAPGTDIKVLATALGVGILLDATIVRALLVPALVSLFGRYNWWLPGWLATVLRVEPSPVKPDVPTEQALSAEKAEAEKALEPAAG
ncbi:MMPL family transporter [Spongisporangium articulatum]|uniref:MMPL family transporter n=1 Tax=Spongisporangium articulatum TaxID=3362603 RepID=A0ABW8AJV3_9ACTN